MKHWARGICAGLCLLLVIGSGCTSSVYPLIGDPTQELDLTGTWVRQNSEGAGPAKIRMVRQKDGRNDLWFGTALESEFLVTLSKIGGDFYLNARHDSSLDDDHDLFGIRTRQDLNLFARIEFRDDRLHVFSVNEPKAYNFLRKHKIDFIDENSCNVLTVNRQKLRELVERHGDEFFTTHAVVYRRQIAEKPSVGSRRR